MMQRYFVLMAPRKEKSFARSFLFDRKFLSNKIAPLCPIAVIMVSMYIARHNGGNRESENILRI